MKIGPDTPALVTGGASGLGEACVRMLRGRGAPVAILDMAEDKGRALAEEVGAAFHPCDVTQEDSVVAALAAARQEHGTARIAISCAGIA
ncbi:MAG: SDR family NAD(P)-dependent oxidoreductase, partial [Pseudomonadota bacterium]